MSYEIQSHGVTVDYLSRATLEEAITEYSKVVSSNKVLFHHTGDTKQIKQSSIVNRKI